MTSQKMRRRINVLVRTRTRFSLLLFQNICEIVPVKLAFSKRILPAHTTVYC